MKTSTSCALALLAAATATAARAQDLPATPPPALRTDLPLATALVRAADLAGAAGALAPAARAELATARLGLDAADRVMIEVVGPLGAPAVDAALVTALGGTRNAVWRHRAELWMPVSRLRQLAASLPPGYRVEPVLPLDYDAGGEGATAMQSDTYFQGGANGSGKTIAIIDGGFDQLGAAANAGDAPTSANRTEINYTPTAFQDSADGKHGTGCTEAAFDNCPGATWRLYKIDSLTDMGVAVGDCIANGVDVISHSISRYNLGWGDNTGDACTAANDAAQAGLLFFTSAGNRAQDHWQGDFLTTDGDDWHEFAGTDETIDLVAAPGDEANFYLSWDPSGGTYDLDLYLYDQSLNVVASSTNGGDTFESFGYTNNTGITQTFHVAVFRSGSGVTEFEIFVSPSQGFNSFQYALAAGSTTSPSNAGEPNVISVGAVAVSALTSANGSSGIIKGYSSQGPSNGGFTLPDLAGPTDTGSVSYSGPFTGTSCATPNAAGAACAFWSSVPGYDANAIRWLLFQQALQWRDWGAPGDDNVYGAGGAILWPHAPNRTWLARGYGNTSNLTTGPAYTFDGAYSQASAGGSVLAFPGGSYPETFTASTSAVLVETTGPAATFGN